MRELSGILKNLRKHLMNGVSYMIPVVVGGGILMALAVLLTGEGAAPMWDAGIPYWLWTIGAYALGLMCPVLAAYIAYSIADRPGLAPGFAGGYMAINIPSGTEKVNTLVEISERTNIPADAKIISQNGIDYIVSTSTKITTESAGFIGAVIAGLIAGIIVFYLKKIKLPKTMSSIKSIIIIPLCSILIVGTIIFICGVPIVSLMKLLEDTMRNLTYGEHGALTLAGISALASVMIAFDLGGPVNKVAYSILMVAFVGSGIYTYAAPIGIAICVPPIGCGVAALILRNKFSREEQHAGIGAIIMGACGISEGAISYTASDPARMIPINMVSAAIAGGLAGFLKVGAKMSTCWGGVIVAPVIQGNNYFSGWPAYLLCIAVGTAVYVVLCSIFKRNHTNVKEEIEDIDISFS